MDSFKSFSPEKLRSVPHWDLVAIAWRMVIRNRKRYTSVMIAIAAGTFLFIIILYSGGRRRAKTLRGS